jgi:hypothetical protein
MKRLAELIYQTCATIFYAITVYVAIGVVIKVLS